MTDSSIVSKIWNLADVLRDDGVGYGDYLEQITYLLFLKMADELNTPSIRARFGAVQRLFPRGTELESRAFALTVDLLH